MDRKLLASQKLSLWPVLISFPLILLPKEYYLDVCHLGLIFPEKYSIHYTYVAFFCLSLLANYRGGIICYAFFCLFFVKFIHFAVCCIWQYFIHYHCSEYPAAAAAAAAKSLQSCLTLWNPIGSSPPGSSIPGILQARTLEWVAISFSNAGKWKVKGNSLSRVWLFATPWTAAYQAPLSMGFSRQEYWSGVPSPSPTQCSMVT